MKPGVLYISYDGMLEPLGESQVVAYLVRLAANYRVHLLSFEKADDWVVTMRRERMTRRLMDAGIAWVPQRYHRRPSGPATGYDIAQGIAAGTWLVRRHRLGIIHARSYVAGTMALAIKRATAATFLFDMRGFWADERLDGGIWRADSLLYRIAKDMERRMLAAADHIVTLTYASVPTIEHFSGLAGRVPPITVIPTCADLAHFQATARALGGPFVLGHVGSLGTWYLPDELLAVFKVLRARTGNAQLLIVNRGEHAMIQERLEAHAIPATQVELISVGYDQVPAAIGRMDAGSAIIKPVFSKLASAPTKLAEYLGCGRPCLGNAGVGDVATVLEGRNVGVALHAFTEGERARAVDRLLALARQPDINSRCVAAANELFLLETGVAQYDSVYRDLMNDGPSINVS